eukprot:XP_020406662.1 uncharacterized protein LOC103652634 [Zea mays]
MATATEDTISDAEEGDDWTHTQSKPRVISNVDDDDGVVFEDDADENEGYLFAGQYEDTDEDTDEDIEIDGSQDESTATDVPDPYDKVYSNIPEETHMLKTVPNCSYCTAKKFEYESPESPSHLCVSVRDYYCYKFQIRPGVFNPILHGKRLFQQFAVDTYIKIESSRLDYIRRNQDRLRADLYQGLVDNMVDGDIRAEKLQLHLPNMHMVAFHERQMVKRVVNRPGADRSMLTAYFEANRLHEEARGILYRDFPEWYTWQSGKGKVWQRRKRDTGGQVGRIVSAHPAEGERYYLRVLLNHVTGAASYVDLRTVDGVTLPTFREAAERRGLLESDNTLDECLTERALFQMPSALRRLFATILVYCEPSDVAVLWQKHKDSMSEDYQHRSQNKTHVEQMVLIDIRNMLQSMGKDIKTLPLPPIIDAYDDAIGTAREVYEEEIIQPTVGDVALKDSLNEEQRAAYDKIMSVVDTDQGGLFFVDGPGGTGKTYLYRVLLATLRNQGKIAVSGTAELLRKASLIIWDEASMTKRQAVEALDNSMRDIMGRPTLPFGGKTIVFGGDFRQVLPVVRKGSRAQVVASSLRMSYLWESMSHLKLVSNMRAKNDPWFAEFLLRVGGGTEETNIDGDIRLPDDVCVPYTGSDNDLDNLIDFAFPNLNENMSDSTYITSRAILSTRNDWVDMINVKMIDRFQGEHMVYHSFDSAMDDPHNYYPPEFLNTLTPNGLPPHVLKLKVGCPVILLRNIDPANGLCNGTRLVVRGFQRNSIDAEIVFVSREWNLYL